MNRDDLLLTKLKQMPASLKAEALDFIEFLLEKQKRNEQKIPVFGSMKGTSKMADDFEEPLDDFKSYME